jgi:hypothetical protein
VWKPKGLPLGDIRWESPCLSLVKVFTFERGQTLGLFNSRDVCFKNTYRIRLTWRWTNTIIHASGNIGVISSDVWVMLNKSQVLFGLIPGSCCWNWSPLARAKRTAEIIWNARKDPMVPIHDLREIDLYSFQVPPVLAGCRSCLVWSLTFLHYDLLSCSVCVCVLLI